MKEACCSFGDGVEVRPNGIDRLDPCLYKVIEVHKNVTVEVLRCKRCGRIELSWYREGE